MSDNREDFCTIEEAVAELRAGRMIILVDDEYRENEGDLVVAAEKATPEAINFMMRNACGMVCLAMAPAICDKLHLEPMSNATADPKVTPLESLVLAGRRAERMSADPLLSARQRAVANWWPRHR